MTEQNGPRAPAFPHLELNDDKSPYYTHPGLTVWDYYAAAAFAALSAPSTAPDAAKWASGVADEMMWQREARLGKQS